MTAATLAEACEHFGVREWGRNAPLAVHVLRNCIERDGCWIRYAQRGSGGYSRVGYRGRVINAHRAMYMLMVGPIPPGLELDHLCHTNDTGCPGGATCTHRACVNPAHLEPVTRRVNTLRGRSPAALNAARTHCFRGHEFTPDNTYTANGRHERRECKTCRRDRHRDYMRAYNAKHRAAKESVA